MKEAIIDIRLAQEFTPIIIKEIEALKIPGFEGQSLPIWRDQFTFQLGPKSDVTQSRESFGRRFITLDGARIVQFRRDGFTYSTMSGYTNWANAKAAAQELWQKYCAVGKPKDVSRVAVRYVNALEFPAGEDLDLYFTVAARVPPGAPDVISGFLHRVTVPFSDDGLISANITQAFEPSTGKTITLILDIDVWHEHVWAVDSVEMWSSLDHLRDIKNMLFFNSVTERALEPYK